MHKKIVSAGVIALFCVALGAAAFAQQGPARRGLLRQFISARVVARLNLTPDQVKKIQQIVRTRRTAARSRQGATAQADLAQERQALLKAIFSDKPEQGEIQKHMDAIVQQQSAADERRRANLSDNVDSMLEINKVLTPAQRTEFQKMLDENARAGQMMRGRMMQRRRGLGASGQQPPSSPKEN